jgi:chemotaxis regulatin CheY-phosphate phosphatase CheZ
MNIKTLIQQIRSKLNPQPELTEEVVVKFLNILEQARAEELSCSEIHARLDEFVENEVETHEAAKIAPLIREHLDMCPDCCEEYEALLAVVAHTKE